MEKLLGAVLVLLVAVLLCPSIFVGGEALASEARITAGGPAVPRVELYTTSWCGYCKKAKAFFRNKGIAFTEYDVEKDPVAAKRFRSMNPRGGVPMVLIGDQQINGYSPSAYETALGE